VAELEFAILAEYARLEPGSGLLTLVGGGFDRVTTQTLPVGLQAAYAVRVSLGEKDEPGADVVVIVESPREEPVLRVVRRLDKPDNSVVVGGKVGVTTVAPLVLSLQVAGAYKVRLLINGTEEHEQAFEVVAATPPADPAV
jgi:hypothetical protein